MRTWDKVILELKKTIKRRELKAEDLRLRTVNRLDRQFRKLYPQVISNPFSLLKIRKSDVCERLEKTKEKKLNSTEKTVINELYNIIKYYGSDLSFYVLVNNKEPNVEKYPYFVLEKDNWDDFGHKTQFMISFYRNKKDIIFLGQIKILDLENDTTILPNKFRSLNENRYCSLGQSRDYYLSLKKIENEIDITVLLNNLNDITHNFGLRELFQENYGYKNSLLRYSEAEKAYAEGYKIVNNIPINNVFNFTFSTKLLNAESEHILDIKFTPKVKNIPFRITALVGRNGTGKTQVLAKLANSLSGNLSGTLSEGEFINDYRPPFSKVIAISYSLFDRFTIPEQSKTFSYLYCGIRRKHSSFRMVENDLLVRLKEAIQRINDKGRTAFYFKIINEVLDENVLEFFLEEDGDFKEQFIKNIAKGKINFSSGQSIYVFILSEIIAYIEDESLVLFDEPETHLHPNAISKIVNIVYKILEKYNSYCILGTHSPIVIQQIPSASVVVFDRQGNIPIIRDLAIESYGENLTTITNEIFETLNVEESYKVEFEKLSKIYSFEEIDKLFKKRLSLNAKIYLMSLYNEKSEAHR